VEIEKVAAETPEKILRERVDRAVGFQPYSGRVPSRSDWTDGPMRFKNGVRFLTATLQRIRKGWIAPWRRSTAGSHDPAGKSLRSTPR